MRRKFQNLVIALSEMVELSKSICVNIFSDT